jgi:hypothetical protein
VFDITYLQSDKYIIHMPQKSLLFYHNRLTYIANMSDWVVNDRQVYATIMENNRLYIKKDIIKAKLATDFFRNISFFTEKKQFDSLKIVM